MRQILIAQASRRSGKTNRLLGIGFFGVGIEFRRSGSRMFRRNQTVTVTPILRTSFPIANPTVGYPNSRILRIASSRRRTGTISRPGIGCFGAFASGTMARTKPSFTASLRRS